MFSKPAKAWGCSHPIALAAGPKKLIAEPVTFSKKYARAKLESATDIGNEIARVYRLAKSDVFDYIERFYNPTRRHSTLGYVSPIQFEEALKA